MIGFRSSGYSAFLYLKDGVYVSIDWYEYFLFLTSVIVLEFEFFLRKEIEKSSNEMNNVTEDDTYLVANMRKLFFLYSAVKICIGFGSYGL